MGWKLVSQGSPIDLINLGQYEDELEEGSHNMIELQLAAPCTPSVAQTIEDALISAGVTGVSVVPGSPLLKIYFTKGFPWLAVIAGVIVPLLIALAIFVIAWKLFTYIGGIAPKAIPLLALAAIGVATVVGIYLVRRKA